MADDDDDAREDDARARGADAPESAARRRGRGGARRAVRRRGVRRVARPAGRLRRPRARGTTSRAFLRDEQQFTQCARRHRGRPPRSTASALDVRRRRRPSASRSSPTSSRTRATGASALIAGPGRRPDGREPRRPSTPASNFAEREVYDLFGIALRRATPTSPASSCPTTGWATRCARTTRPPACR